MVGALAQLSTLHFQLAPCPVPEKPISNPLRFGRSAAGFFWQNDGFAPFFCLKIFTLAFFGFFF